MQETNSLVRGEWLDRRWARHKSRAFQERGRTRQDITFHDTGSEVFRLRSANEKSRPTLVLCADAPVVLEHYDELLKSVPDIGIVVFELPGFGFSTVGPNYTFAPKGPLQAIRKLLLDLDRGPYILGLSCAAGLLSFPLARDPALDIEQVLFIQTTAPKEQIAWAHRVDLHGLCCRPYVGQAMVRAFRRQVGRAWLRNSAASAKEGDKLIAPSNEAFAKGANFSLASGFQGLITSPIPNFGPISQPATILFGMADRTHGKSQ